MLVERSGQEMAHLGMTCARLRLRALKADGANGEAEGSKKLSGNQNSENLTTFGGLSEVDL